MKQLENKLEQIARREEMRKLGITSEKEYLAYLASQKKKEIPPTPPKDAQAEKSKPIELEKPKPVVIEQPVVIATSTPQYVSSPHQIKQQGGNHQNLHG